MIKSQSLWKLTLRLQIVQDPHSVHDVCGCPRGRTLWGGTWIESTSWSDLRCPGKSPQPPRYHCPGHGIHLQFRTKKQSLVIPAHEAKETWHICPDYIYIYRRPSLLLRILLSIYALDTFLVSHLGLRLNHVVRVRQSGKGWSDCWKDWSCCRDWITWLWKETNNPGCGKENT